MERKLYSAGAVKFCFWFLEFRQTIQLLAEGNTLEGIKELNKTNNIFGASTVTRRDQIYSTVSGRIKCLGKSIYPLFLSSDVSTQKIIVLIAAMAHDTMFFDFVYEVIRDKMLIGSNEFSDSDFRIFFQNKQIQDEKVAAWTDATIIRLCKTYKNALREAGLTEKINTNTYRIIRPIISEELSRWLVSNGQQAALRALKGE